MKFFPAMNTTKDKLKVFLVDDDNMFTESLKHALNGETTEVSTFPTGEDCLKNVRKEEPEVVVLDYYFNNSSSKTLNGIQVLNKIKHINPATEVIMLSAQDSVAVAIDTLKYGAYDYVAKGQSSFIQITHDIRHIYESKERTANFDKENNRLKRINVLILVIVVTLYILSRVL